MNLRQFSLLRAGLVGAVLLPLAVAGCGGGSSPSPRPTPTPTVSQSSQIARWKPIIAAETAAIASPPAAGSSVEQNEIAQLLALQNARTPAQIAIFNKWNNRAASGWNQIARELVISNATTPPPSARIYAALSVAQFDAVIAAARAQTNFRRKTPAQTDARVAPLATSDDGYPSRTAAMCSASAGVLKSLYPNNKAQIESEQSECEQSRLVGGVNFPSDVEAGALVGDEIAAKTLVRLATDNSDKAAQTRPQPTGPGFWTGKNGLLPSWQIVKPWLTDNITPLRAPTPPAFSSAQFAQDLAEVRQISDNRTSQQLQIAQFWADAAGTFTPPGHWNLFAQRIIASHNLTDAQAARVYALLNMAQHNASIACWADKYDYWVIRPSQADPNITTPIGLPNFPSYTSGHSTFSGSAAGVLGALFPDEKSVVDQLAREASVSRVYGGIHYRFDADGGLESGRKVAALANVRAQSDGYNGGVPSGRTLSFAELKSDTEIEMKRLAPMRLNRSLANAD